MRKFAAFAMGIILLVGGLSGCSDNEKSELNFVNASDLAADSNAEIPPIVFSENSSQTSVSTSEIESSTSDNSTIISSSENLESSSSSSENPTEIAVPTSCYYYTATAEITEYNAEKVKSVFFGNTEVTEEILNYPERKPIYIWKNGGKRLYVSNDYASIEYTSELSNFINTVFRAPTQNTKGNADLFAHCGENLGFCTRDEAVKIVRKTLSELGISVTEKAEVYALCKGDLQAVVDEKCAEGRFCLYDFEGNETPTTSYTVTPEQECYYIVFNAAWNSVPIYNDALYFKTIKDLAIFHPTITAIFSANGLVELKVNEYRSIKCGEKISQLISPETAAQIVGEKYKDVVGIEKIEFDKMALMYVLSPISENGKINLNTTNLTLAWVCTVKMTEFKFDRKTNAQTAVVSRKDVFIDAQTGAEII